MEPPPTTPNPLETAKAHATLGERTEPRNLFRNAVNSDPKDYRAWLWLAYTAETQEEKRAALYQALKLNPTAEKVRGEFKRMHTPAHLNNAAARGVFTCYHPSDDMFAIEMVERLKERQLPVWIDALEVAADADWRAEVKAALARCGMMLLVVSEAMIGGQETRAELDYFLSKGKIVLPILYKDCDPTPLTLMHSMIDFRKDYKSGLRLLFALLGITRQVGDR